VQDVARWVQQLGGPSIDGEDLVHEVFLIARDKLDEFRGEARVTTWLYRITFRVVWAHRRKQRRRRWLQIVGLAEEAPVVESPARMVEARQKLRRVYSVLDELPEKQRAALILFEIEGLSGEEIAAVMDMKLPAVWVLLHRARQSFQSRFERDGED
jgi:RNA polymerase sigma-70 factor (ECF subfamily)